ncbi:MAG: hypothetical protein JNK32_10070 [Anaerolineales bacterium]|nr:hypothetical protein [Anaerolineales bacterium]
MIYDFYELFGRGIIAARTGRFHEALEYLLLASRVESGNPRVWLWLAASAESEAQTRRFLEAALKIDPNLFMARVLLHRLNSSTVPVHAGEANFVIFSCPSCGGKQRFDPDMMGLLCQSCGTLERLPAQDASDAEIQLNPGGVSGNWAVTESQVNCDACGAMLSIPASQVTHPCPFCGSENINLLPATPNMISPTAIAPFRLHGDDVRVELAKALGISIHKIDQLAKASKLHLAPIYLPFWTFDATVQLYCALERHVPAEEFAEDERVILKGEWPLQKSWFECDLNDWPVYAARRIQDRHIGKIFPFDLTSLFTYRPEMLAGWQAETVQLALTEAAVQAHKQMRDLALKKAALRGLFIEPARLLRDDVQFHDRTYKLILLPIWVARWTMNGKSFRALINGQTGKVPGEEDA